MCDSNSIELNFKIGILKELHKRKLINKDELNKSIKIIEQTAKGVDKN